MYRRCHFTAVSFCCPLEFQTRPLVGHRQRRTTSTSTTTGRTILFCAAAVMVVCLAPATAATTTAWSIARRGGRPASSGGNGLTRRHLWKQCQPNRLWQSAAGFTIATTNDNKIGCFFASSSTAASAAAATTLAPPATSSVALQSMDYSSNNQNDDTSTTTKPAALFLHGLLGNKRNFASIGTSLSQQIQTPRRLIGLDLRNHGENHHDWREDMSYASMAADVLSFCDLHGLEQVELIGHSVGGKVAQAVALLQPDRVKGLVVIDIAPVQYSTEEPHWRAVEDIVDALLSVNLLEPNASKRDVDVKLRSFIPDPALRAFCLTNFHAGAWKVPLPIIRSQLESLAGFDVNPRSSQGDLPTFGGDAFFIHGGQSRFVRHQHLETIGQYFPNHMLTTIKGAGHWVHAEAPEDTTALLQRFLDR